MSDYNVDIKDEGGGSRTVVYLDVLLCVNLIVNYFLILSSCFFTKEIRRRGRFALAAAVGALFSLSVVLPSLGIMMSLIIKLAGCCAMTLTAFGFGNTRRFIMNALYIFAISALFAGAVAALRETGLGNVLAERNMSVYADINAIVLIGLVTGFYVLLCIAELLFKRPRQLSSRYAAEIAVQGKTLNFSAMLDSGNKLRDPLTGRQAVVLRRSMAPRLLDRAQLAALGEYEKTGLGIEKLRLCTGAVLLPFATIREKGLLLAFPAQRCEIKVGKELRAIERPLVTFADGSLLGDADGIVSADILEEIYNAAAKNSNEIARTRTGTCKARRDILHQRAGNTAAADQQGGGAEGVCAARTGLDRGARDADYAQSAPCGVHSEKV